MTGYTFFPVAVRVTGDLLESAGRTCLDCPVALAVRRALPAADVRVFADTIHIDFRPHDAPGVVRRFVREWDDVFTPLRKPAGQFAEFAFELLVWVPEWAGESFAAANGLSLEAWGEAA